MPQVAREGDTSDHGGGSIKSPDIEPTVFVNGKPIAINIGTGTGASIDQLWDDNGSDPDTHPLGKTNPGPSEGSNTVFAGGFGVHRFRDDRFCGAETTTASPNVWADSIPQIRVPGATVQDPIASLAAPTGMTFPYTTLFAFSGKVISDCNGDPVTPDVGPDYVPGYNREAFYTIKQSGLEKTLLELTLADFQFVGTSIKFNVAFPDGLEEFEVPELDLGQRDSIPAICANSNQEVVGGLRTKGFPSFGLVSEKDLSIEIVNKESLINTHDDYGGFNIDTGQFINKNLHKTPPSGGYSFLIGNESGSVSLSVNILILPALPIEAFNTWNGNNEE
jgi:hypothetical protein